MIRLLTFIISFTTFASSILSQKHTVGLITADNAKAFKGYNLIYPHEQPDVYLLNNCGQIVNKWTDVADSRPGNTVYLLEDGSILKTKRSSKVTGNPIWSGGGGGTVERRDWKNNLIWTFTLNDSFNRLHHDIEPMPNGNILMISWEKKTAAQAIAKGRNPSTLAAGEIWSDKIIEVKPIGKDSFSIVWEWHLWDHLIQNFDSTKANYGKPEDNPGSVDINYATLNSAKNWAFLNAVSYNIGYDQIVVSSPSFNEVWIIDHSTTTAQAASKSGGFSTKGGELMYRWGNPAAYNSGTASDQRLFFPHDAHWIAKNTGEKDFGKIFVFNNRAGADFSSVNIIEPNFDYYLWKYLKNINVFFPKTFYWAYKRPDSTALYSSALSSVQRLPNGNTLICSGQQGYTFEITPDKEIVWEYVTPFKTGVRAKQGDTLKLSENSTFRVKRYGVDFEGFIGKDLSPKGYIEQNPDTAFCQISVSIKQVKNSYNVLVQPNPVENMLHVSGLEQRIFNISLYSSTGICVFSESYKSAANIKIDVKDFPSGIYYLGINNNTMFKKVNVLH